MHDLPKSSGTQPEYVVVLELHALTFVLYVVPLGQLLLPPEEDDPELDPELDPDPDEDPPLAKHFP